ADECRLVTRAATGDDSNLPGNRCVLGDNDSGIFGEAHDVGMRLYKTLDRVFDHKIRVIDKTLHDNSFRETGMLWCDGSVAVSGSGDPTAHARGLMENSAPAPTMK